MLVKRHNVAFFGILFQRQQKDDIVREYDNLPVLRFLHKPLCDVAAPFKVERGNRVVEHDCGRVIGGAEFGEESRNRDAALFALAYDFGTSMPGYASASACGKKRLPNRPPLSIQLRHG